MHGDLSQENGTQARLRSSSIIANQVTVVSSFHATPSQLSAGCPLVLMLLLLLLLLLLVQRKVRLTSLWRGWGR
jgi:hypothetical protein